MFAKSTNMGTTNKDGRAGMAGAIALGHSSTPVVW